ncbi:hypothetical protein OH76DRAFT_1401644 [Lentinus brumalis]|uniref:F-box domain-containing protein n=1 Tax=Lentinus brumalis TaxID=2498619 RepID=A0A371DFJ7_9APHY|nr:hypothetical protein OH76DRAFT_1401644 [Polyporus brumalis]
MGYLRVLQAYQQFQKVLHSEAGTCLDDLSDDDLEALEQELAITLSALRTRRNSSRRHAQIPVEILTTIFRYVLDPSTVDVDSFSKPDRLAEAPPDTWSLLAVSHVCGRWRTASTMCATLWSGITITKSHCLTTLFLERSGVRPLRIFADESRWPLGGMAEAFTPLRAHCERVREVFLSTCVEIRSDSGDNLLDALSPLSHVVYLSLARSDAPSEYHQQQRNQGAVYVRQFFDNITVENMPITPPTAPHLRALSLSVRSGLFPIDRFPSLVHLRLEGSVKHTIKLHDLLNLLAGTPLIETVHASSIIRVRGAVLKAVTLPRIRVFSLADLRSSIIAAVSQHITIPREAMLQLRHIQLDQAASHADHFALPVLDGFTELEIAQYDIGHRIRARGQCSAVWLHFGAFDFQSSRRVVPAILARLSPLLSTVQTVRFAVEPYTLLRCVLGHTLPTVQKYCPAISTLVIACCGEDERSRMLEFYVDPSSDPWKKCQIPHFKLSLPPVENLHIQVTRPVLQRDMILEMIRSCSKQRQPLASLIFSAPGGALAVVDGDYSKFEKHVGRVESTATKLWDPGVMCSGGSRMSTGRCIRMRQ